VSIAIVLAIASVAPAAAPQKPVDTVVVCPTAFRESLEPWLAHRRRQGHTVQLLDNAGEADAIRSRIRTAFGERPRDERPRFLVLIGDADPLAERFPAIRARSIPTHKAKAKINIHWGSEPEIATDNWFADVDDDELPDVAVGRLTADTPDELRTIVRKIIAYERGDGGVWRRRVNLVAGVGGFGALADATIETAAKYLINQGLPPAYETTMTYGSWRSPYCPDPRRFRDTTVQRLNEGSMFWVYIGHGQRRWLDQVRVEDRHYPVLGTDDVQGLRCAAGSPIALFLACYTGAFDDAGDCLAEEMLRKEGAPVAIVCGSRVTMPYAMSVLASEMMTECFVERRETIGEVLLRAKRSMASPQLKSARAKVMEAVAAFVSPSGTSLMDERREHLHLFNLIGDPLLRLPHSRPVTIEAPRTVKAGDTIWVNGACDLDGPCTLELVVRRDRLPFAPPARAKFDAGESALASYDDVYRRANDARLAAVEVKPAGGRFAARLAVPADARGACHIRAFVRGANASALGATDVLVQPAGAPPGDAPAQAGAR
jgi:hypothetical protein